MSPEEKLRQLINKREEKSSKTFHSIPTGTVFVKVVEGKAVGYRSSFDRISKDSFIVELKVGSINGLTEALILDDAGFKVRHPELLHEKWSK